MRQAADEAAAHGFFVTATASDLLAHAIPLSSLQKQLERQALSAPVLACLDDLHRESEVSLTALQSLQRALSPQPLAWLLARSSTVRDGADQLFSLLERDGAVRLMLGPLDEQVAVTMLTDAFGAPPDPALAELAQGAGGNPFLLTELISGDRKSVV